VLFMLHLEIEFRSSLSNNAILTSAYLFKKKNDVNSEKEWKLKRALGNVESLKATFVPSGFSVLPLAVWVNASPTILDVWHTPIG